MSSNVSTGFAATYLSGTMGAQSLSIALIGPDISRRKTMAMALAENGRTNVREFETFPVRSEEFRWLTDQSFDVILFDLDSDPDVVLDLVERVRAGNSGTVMVYSEHADTKLAVRFMRAGAREYLLLPLEDGVVAEALDRVKADRVEKIQPAQRRAGNLFVFVCPKGGCGATTVACNLAVALAGNSEQKTLLIDLALPIGDAALALGISAQYSTEDAIRNAGRLDANLLKELLVKHQSELNVLAAPSNIPGIEGCEDAIDKLISVARREFDHVVVDIGSRMDLMDTALFRQASTVYLVTLSGISELRNSNRLISQFFPEGGPNLEVVINRFENRLLGGVREDDVAKALGRPVRWKVPEDQEAAREMQYGATGVGNTRISTLSLEMAAAITGRPAQKEKKKGFSLKGSSRTAVEEDSSNEPLQSLKIPSSEPPQNLKIPSSEPLQSVKIPSSEPLQSIRIPTPAVRRNPVLNWSAPSAIAYGDALSSAELNASASVSGTLVYTPAAGIVLPAGTHNLSATFTPDDSENYTTAKITVPIQVEIATPVIEWQKPDPIPYGTQLGVGQLRATASVPGSFEYSPEPREILSVGTHQLSVSFMPDDTENYATAQATVLLEVEKATPAIAWPKPDSIPCGTPLDARQLCAGASVKGRFDYAPASGETLPAGTHKLSVSFTPVDTRNYYTAQATVLIDVEKSQPVIAWPRPDSIPSGTPLGADQLNARASAAGTLVYKPAAGTVLPAGTHKLSVIFNPADRESCATAQATVLLEVEKAVPVISWSKPESFVCGTPLGSAQLNAKASVAGTLVYTPAPGAMLPAGTHKLSVAFTPADRENYSSAQATVLLEVGQATPVIAWPKLHPMSYGTVLGTDQLCAQASVPGRFNYSPAPGEVLPVGKHELSVTFTPADGKNYTAAQATVHVEVEKATPVVAWPKPDSIQYGTPLSTSELCAAASVPGNFDYAPSLGEVLPAGTNKLAATFVPADGASFNPVRSIVPLEVTKAIPRIAWPAPQSIRCDIALGDAQLCASSPVAGSFSYTPGPKEVLPVGTHTLSATFIPKDSANYASAVATVSIKVLDKPASSTAWTNSDPSAAEAHTFSGSFNTPDSPRNASVFADKPAAHTERTAPEKPAYADKSAAQADKSAAHIEWPVPQPMKHGKPLRASEAEAAASASAPPNDAAAQTKVPAQRVTPFPSITEKYKPANTRTENQVEAPRDASKFAPSPSREVIAEPVQKSGFAPQRQQADDKAKEASADIDWLSLQHEILPQDDPLESKISGLLNAAKKKWVLISAGAGALLLVIILVFISHSRAEAPAQVVTVPPPVAADSQATNSQFESEDNKPSPQRSAAVQNETIPKAAAVNTAPAQNDSAQTDAAQADPTPGQSGPTSAQAAMMHDQLNAPSRISQQMQQQTSPNAPPPANFSAANNMGGGGNIGNVFGGKAPSVVAAQHGPLAISAGVAMGLLTQKTAPLYPEIAKKARVSGTVQLVATISKAGRVEDVHVLSGPVMLQGAALEAVRSWRYRPYIVDNQPTEVKTTVYVAFSLGN